MEELCRDVLEAAGVRNVVCLVSAADARIAPEKLIPISLIVTELISNALEHGLANQPKGTIRIDLTENGTEQVLTVADDGRGLPADFSLEKASGLGLRIVQALVQQVQGRFAMENGRGTTCRIVFDTATLATAA
jgi:two-component sensor histidine kinase